eukprot:COSAG01_NODE_2754_length_7138_cov_16.469953_9_plen_224_part_00
MPCLRCRHSSSCGDWLYGELSQSAASATTAPMVPLLLMHAVGSAIVAKQRVHLLLPALPQHLLRAAVTVFGLSKAASQQSGSQRLVRLWLGKKLQASFTLLRASGRVSGQMVPDARTLEAAAATGAAWPGTWARHTMVVVQVVDSAVVSQEGEEAGEAGAAAAAGGGGGGGGAPTPMAIDPAGDPKQQQQQQQQPQWMDAAGAQLLAFPSGSLAWLRRSPCTH